MKLFRNIPDWVKDFSVPYHKEALLQLAKASKGPFDKPREMNYVLVGLEPGKRLDELTRLLTEAGWKCSTQEQEGAPEKIVLTATVADYRITEETYIRDLKFFRELEDAYGFEYDGWFASN